MDGFVVPEGLVGFVFRWLGRYCVYCLGVGLWFGVWFCVWMMAVRRCWVKWWSRGFLDF